MNEEIAGKRGVGRDEDLALIPLFLPGCFYESAFLSKNTSHTPCASLRSLDVLVVTLLWTI